MPRHHIAVLILDAGNLAEMGRHAVSAREVEQVVFNRYITVPNPRGKPGSLLLIGQTSGGRILTIPLDPTDDPGTWRPPTAFDASSHQRALFQQHAR